MKNKTNYNMQKKNSYFEFITAFAIMTVVLYIFIRRENSKLSDKFTQVDATIHTTSETVRRVGDSVSTIFPYIRRLDEDNIQFSINQDMMMSIMRDNSEILRTNTQMIIEQSNWLRNIERKQNTILETVKENQNVDSFFLKRVGGSEN